MYDRSAFCKVKMCFYLLFMKDLWITLYFRFIFWTRRAVTKGTFTEFSKYQRTRFRNPRCLIINFIQKTFNFSWIIGATADPRHKNITEPAGLLNAIAKSHSVVKKIWLFFKIIIIIIIIIIKIFKKLIWENHILVYKMLDLNSPNHFDPSPTITQNS